MTLSAYTIIKSLQFGSYGEVFLATDKYENPVAIKIIDINRMRRYGITKQMIIDEFSTAELLSSACKDSTVTFYEYFQDVYKGKAVMCLVTEYISGNSLSKYIEDNDITNNTRAIWSLFYFLSKGLLCLHSEGFAHQDIKPDNIMITDDINIKYIDFGTNCVKTCKWSDCENVCKTDLQTGTPLYNPPEYIDTKLALTGLIGAKSHDIWSLGIVFYKIAFGYQNLPFIQNKTSSDFISSVRAGILNISHTKITHPHDADIGNLIKSMLVKNPLYRPSIDTVFNAIVEYITDRDIFQNIVSDESSTLIMDDNDDDLEEISDINISEHIDDL